MAFSSLLKVLQSAWKQPFQAILRSVQEQQASMRPSSSDGQPGHDVLAPKTTDMTGLHSFLQDHVWPHLRPDDTLLIAARHAEEVFENGGGRPLATHPIGLNTQVVCRLLGHNI